MRDNHFTTLVDYKEREFWLVFDSYDEILKKIDWKMKFEVAKRYYIALSTVKSSSYRNWLGKVLKLMKMR